LFFLLSVFLDHLGADNQTIGRINGTEALAAVLVRPIVGSLLDRKGRRPVLLFGGVINLIACLLYLTVHELGLWIYLVRIVHGAAIGIQFSALFTVASDIVPARRLTEGLAVFGSAGMLSMALAPLLGEWLLSVHNFATVFSFAAVLALGALVLSIPVTEPSRHHHHPAAGRFLKPVFKRKFFTLWIATLALGLGIAAFFNFLAVFAEKIELQGVSLFFVIYVGTAIVLRVAGGAVPDRVGRERVLVISIAVFALGTALLATVSGALLLAAAGFLCGIGHGYLFPITNALVVERALPENRGAAITFFTALIDVAIFVGSPFLGWIADWSSYRWMYGCTGVIILAAAMMFYLFDRPDGDRVQPHDGKGVNPLQ